MLEIIKTLCKKLETTGEVDTNDFTKVVDFIRTFADKYHHRKEEEIWFKYARKQGYT